MALMRRAMVVLLWAAEEAIARRATAALIIPMMTTSDRRPKVLSTFRALANAILGKTGKSDRLDTAACMAQDADFSRGDAPPTPEPEPAQKVDQIDELMRIVGAQGKEPPPRRSKVPTFRRRPRSR